MKIKQHLPVVLKSGKMIQKGYESLAIEEVSVSLNKSNSTEKSIRVERGSALSTMLDKIYIIHVYTECFMVLSWNNILKIILVWFEVTKILSS